MNSRLSRLFMFLYILLLNGSCDDGESLPDFTGRWEYDQASPPENVDTCYAGSWMWIYENNEFTIFDACNQAHAGGWWSSQGGNISVGFTDDGFEDFQAKIITLTDNVLVLETAMFGQLTKVRFLRANQADQRNHSDTKMSEQ